MLRRFTAHGLHTSRLSVQKIASRFCLSINVPTIAESISSGKVVGWTKKVGDTVSEDEVICQIESDKLNVDVRAPANGVITQINFEDDAVVEVGAELSKMREAVAPAKAKEADAAAPATEQQPPLQQQQQQQQSQAQTQEKPKKPVGAPAPAQRSQEVAVATGSDPRVRNVRISSMRQRIADRLKASQNTCAMLTTFNEIDMTPLIEMRNRYKDEFQKKHNVKLGFMSPFVKACAIALQDVPIVNASFGTEFIEYHDYVDISIAVSTPRGLVVPVLRDVQKSNFAQIEKQIADFGERAKVNKLTLAEMTGGTFTISNGGVFGSWMGTPIINPPQSAILGMHATKKKPWVVGNEVKVRDVMAVALTYDHRLIDGSDAVTFLVKVKNLIEDPSRMVLDLA